MAKLSRREFLGLGLAAAAATSAAYASAFTVNGDIELSEVPISIPELPNEFYGYRIGFLTDLHLGRAVPHEWIDDALRLVSAASVDIILLGGDYLWAPDSFPESHLSYVRNRRFDNLSQAKLPLAIIEDAADLIGSHKAPDGVLAVLGNHDRWNLPLSAFSHFTRHGIKVLINNTMSIHRGGKVLTIIGVDDYWTGLPRWPRKIAAGPTLLLSHNPDFASYLVNNTQHRFDLALCGHTHGGQFKIPGLGAPFCNIQDRGLLEGLAEIAGCRIYTSRGVGMSKFPFRVNCPPEAVVVTLVAA
jgi:predicted MPP superfamily phosphohydrolase